MVLRSCRVVMVLAYSSCWWGDERTIWLQADTAVSYLKWYDPIRTSACPMRSGMLLVSSVWKSSMSQQRCREKPDY